MALTIAQLEQVRRFCEVRMAVNYTEPQVNTAAQAVQTWVEANRGGLPNIFTDADLSGAQATTIRGLITGPFTNAQKAVLFNGVAFQNRIIPAPPPDPAEDPAVTTAVRTTFVNLFSAAIDAAKPGLTTAEKVRAIRVALGF